MRIPIIQKIIDQLRGKKNYYHFSSEELKLIVIEENGKERLAKPWEFPQISIYGSGKNNIIKIELPCHKKLNATISYSNSSNNSIIIHKNVSGIWNIACYDSNNTVEIGEETNSCDVWISLIGNTLKIGKDCMFSNGIHIWGDGHSVLDYKTKELLNEPHKPILIGDHCWIGERVTLTKNTQIPNDCIVGIASVVTKKFEEEHCVIAGAPAKIVKTNISWHGLSPLNYKKQIQNKQNNEI